MDENQNQISKEKERQPLSEHTSIPPKPNSRCILIIASGNESKMKDQIISFLKNTDCECHFSLDAENSQKPLTQKAIQFEHIKHAFVLLTPDNFVYEQNSKPADATMQTDGRIAFECGFWTAKFGRGNIASIYYNQKSFQNPTKTFDTFTIPFDKTHAWKAEILQRLRHWELIKPDIKIS